MAFLISGAIGNFIDRLLRGFVVDFLDFSHLALIFLYSILLIYVLI